jgi:hypothetical protein
MRYLLAFCIQICSLGCQFAENNHRKFDSTAVKTSNGGSINLIVDGTPDYASAPDSLANEIIDTTTLEGKRHKILNQFIVENGLVTPESDTLLDLNYDGYKDYILRYYGRSGTGIKNAVRVYLFQREDRFYYFDSVLSALPNPSFYIPEKKITGFYIGNGGGSGVKLEWIKKKWTVTKEFRVDSEGDSTRWFVTYPQQMVKKVIRQPFQMIPPGNILETSISY